MGIQLKNVSYSYKGKFQTVKAADGVSDEFEPGKSGKNADLPQLQSQGKITKKDLL